MTLSQRLKRGLPAIATGIAVATIVVVIVGLLGVVLRYGVAHFWPGTLYTVSFERNGQVERIFAQVHDRQFVTSSGHEHWFMSSAGRNQFGEQEYIVETDSILDASRDLSLVDVALTNGNHIYAQLNAILHRDQRWPDDRLPEVLQQVHEHVAALESFKLEKLAPLHQKLARFAQQGVSPDAPAHQALQREFEQYQAQLASMRRQVQAYRLQLSGPDGEPYNLSMDTVAQVVALNQLSWQQKLGRFFIELWSFLSTEPKSSSDKGGVFPALFGTVVMVLLMAIIVAPLGVVAAIYLSEYAPDNYFTSLVRIAVNNLAGVPSIVFGVFGLGFLVYGVGDGIDQWLFSDTLPTPTFGSPGLFWASLTMAMLTLPVVIVATEEGLRRVPRSLRYGSFALGATKYETIRYTVLPMASPGIMTGVVLAIARGAGEVAPLLLVGAVKFAPSLPIDGTFPYIHLERQFMHLGVLIYDGAFHSNHLGHSSSMMFAACLLLLVVVLVLNVAAVLVRGRLRQRYQSMIR